MSQPATRMPTQAEAVQWILRHRYPAAKQYRREYLAWLREKIGDAFADAVEREVKARWRSN